MIQLGLSKITNFVSPKRSDPAPRAIVNLPRHLEEALAETVAWCSLKSSLSHDLRSPELDPSKNLLEEPFPKMKEAIIAWDSRRDNQFASAVLHLAHRRCGLLQRMEQTRTAENESKKANGRLLVYFPRETVNCGVSQASSQGFFDLEDAPPWDTWISYSNHAILCWIPNDFIPRAQAGIDANPVDCIHWPTSRELSQLTS